MKKIGIGLVVLLACFAGAAVVTGLATDNGGQVMNHSQGQVIFPFSKLKTASSAKTVPFYTTAAIWPTTFVPETIVWDAGLGCVKRTLTETPLTGTPSGFNSSATPLYCEITVPFESLDAGTHTIFRALDGGFGVSTCASAATVPATAWSALCHRQAGISP